MEPRITSTFEDFFNFIATEPSQDIESYKKEFFARIESIADLIDSSNQKEQLKEEFFKMCNPLEDSIMHKRTREKPLGYSGDFLLIDWIYTKKTADSPRGKFFDQLFHSFEASESVRNRKEFFIKKCQQIADNATGPVKILDLGCGSCRDVLEAFQSVSNHENLFFHCIDQEPEAINYAKDLFVDTPYYSHITFEQSNIFFIKRNQNYDYIWSAGLFDYLDDRTIKILLKKLWKILTPGGKIIFGNFSPKNPTKKGMELVGKWYLIHRSAEQLLDISQGAGINYSKIEIESEPQGINLFCEIQK